MNRVGVALENVPIVKFICVFLPFSAAYWTIDSVCLTWVIQRFNTPLRLRDIMPIRASMYLLALINTNLGQGGVAWYLHRKTRIPFLEVLSSILFIALMEVYQLFLFSTLGIVFYQSGSPGQNEIVGVMRVGIRSRMAIARRGYCSFRPSTAQRSYACLDQYQPVRSDREDFFRRATTRLCDCNCNQGAHFPDVAADAVCSPLTLRNCHTVREADALSSPGLSGCGVTNRGRASWHQPGCLAAFLFG